ncbi:MAG: FAD-binding oxidoreductase [Alphaproteobacteria bacterium]
MTETKVTNNRTAGIEAVVAGLDPRFANRVTTSLSVRQAHGQDLTWAQGAPPDAVFFAQSSDEVCVAVRLCAQHRVPIIPFGTGTSLEGHISAPHGGLSIDLSQMNKVLEVRTADLDCTVEAGVTRKQLNEALHGTGLFFPIDPGADASLGGMAATRASGTNAVRYGTMREAVLNLTVVLPDGQIINTARRARKSAAGYDLTRLMVGSEGTLGVITKVSLRLHGLPEAISAGVCPFDTLQGACDAVIMTIQSGIPVSRIELLDEVAIKGINQYSKMELAEKPTLFVEFHGSTASVAEQATSFGEIAAEFGGGHFEWATRTEDRTRLWQARHDVFFAGLALAPGRKGLSTDVCVPISRLADCVIATKRDIEESGFIGPIAGHAGDGNFHVLLLVDVDDGPQVARAHQFLDRLVERALEMEGTCTGEHGVGVGKIKYLRAEHGAALDVMVAIKRAIDPQCIMNPGKILAL